MLVGKEGKPAHYSWELFNQSMDKKSDLSILAENYDENKSYEPGDYCTQGGLLYRCLTAAGYGKWNAAHWQAVTVGAELSAGKEDIDSLIRAIMMNELTLPLAADGGEKLLTDGGTPVDAVYRPNQRGGVMTALEAMAEELSRSLTGKIATAKQEAVSEAGTAADAKITAHNTAAASHPAHLSIVQKL